MLFFTTVQVFNHIRRRFHNRYGSLTWFGRCYRWLLTRQSFIPHDFQAKKLLHHLSVVSVGWTLSGEKLYCFITVLNGFGNRESFPLWTFHAMVISVSGSLWGGVDYWCPANTDTTYQPPPASDLETKTRVFCQWCVELWSCDVWDMESGTQTIWGVHKSTGDETILLAWQGL